MPHWRHLWPACGPLAAGRRPPQLGRVSSGKATETSSMVMLSTMEVSECRLWASAGSAASRWSVGRRWAGVTWRQASPVQECSALPRGTRGTGASSQLRSWGWAGVGSSYSDCPGSWSLGGVSWEMALPLLALGSTDSGLPGTPGVGTVSSLWRRAAIGHQAQGRSCRRPGSSWPRLQSTTEALGSAGPRRGRGEKPGQGIREEGRPGLDTG